MLIRPLVLIALALAFYSLPASGQVKITRTEFPHVEWHPPELKAGQIAGTATDDFTDILPISEDYFVDWVFWDEERNDACVLKIKMQHVHNGERITFETYDRCDTYANWNLFEPLTHGRWVNFTHDGLIRGGFGSGLSLCINNGKMKGLRTESIEPRGEIVFVEETETLIRQKFVPTLIPVPGVLDQSETQGDVELWSPLGFLPEGEGLPGERGVLGEEKFTANCKKKKGWTEPARCNPDNRIFESAITGLRVFYRDGRTIVGMQPFCSRLRLTGALLRPLDATEPSGGPNTNARTRPDTLKRRQQLVPKRGLTQ
ncbi:MAG: hypothetical protein AAF416_22585 [Pseudomonadota bacterium]